MKKSLKRMLCSVLVLVFLFANANVAFAGELMYPDAKLSYPKLYDSTKTSVVGIEDAFDVKAFNTYLVEQLKVVDEGDINISQFKIPVTTAPPTKIYIGILGFPIP